MTIFKAGNWGLEKLNGFPNATELLGLLSDGFRKGLGDPRQAGWEQKGGIKRIMRKEEKYSMNSTFLL